MEGVNNNIDIDIGNLKDLDKNIMRYEKNGIEIELSKNKLRISCKNCGHDYYIYNNGKVDLVKIYLKGECYICNLRKLPYKEYLQTKHWLQIRDLALLKADYKCQLCSSKENLQVHHNNYKNIGCEMDSDVVVLCKDCHSKFHQKEKMFNKEDMKEFEEWLNNMYKLFVEFKKIS